MAKIEISIDTADKSKSFIKVDSKILKNVYSTYIYGMDEPDYMSIEINQFEKLGDEDGALRKMTRLVASANEGWKVTAEERSEEINDEDRETIAKMLIRRHLDS